MWKPGTRKAKRGRSPSGTDSEGEEEEDGGPAAAKAKGKGPARARGGGRAKRAQAAPLKTAEWELEHSAETNADALWIEVERPDGSTFTGWLKPKIKVLGGADADDYEPANTSARASAMLKARDRDVERLAAAGPEKGATCILCNQAAGKEQFKGAGAKLNTARKDKGLGRLFLVQTLKKDTAAWVHEQCAAWCPTVVVTQAGELAPTSPWPSAGAGA